MRRKLSLLALIVVGMLVVFFGLEIFAQSSQSFSGTTRGDSWQRVSQGYVEKQTNGNPWVNWTYSEHGNSHHQWFSIIPEGRSDGVGEVKITGYGRSDIASHDAGIGNSYYLKSKREHFTDPGTYVSGTWSPN